MSYKILTVNSFYNMNTVIVITQLFFFFFFTKANIVGFNYLITYTVLQCVLKLIKFYFYTLHYKISFIIE